MAERFTTIRTSKKNAETGYRLYGRQTKEEMVQAIRAYADRMRQEVAAIDAVADDQFHIFTHTGSVVVRKVEIIQKGLY